VLSLKPSRSSEHQPLTIEAHLRAGGEPPLERSGRQPEFFCFEQATLPVMPEQSQRRSR
jgi:hypothetical protein